MSSLLLLPEIKETDAKEKEFPETPLQIKTITSLHFSPKMRPSQSGCSAVSPPSGSIQFAVIGRFLKPGGYSPLSSTSLRGGCEVRCRISSPSADRISRVWYWAVWSLQSVSLPRRAHDFASLPLRPAEVGSLPLRAMPLTDTDSAGAQWMVVGYPCAPITGPLTPPSCGSDET